jgi:hypothetical protein
MLEYLYQALRSARGIVLRTSDRERLRQKLYAARRDAGDTDLDVIALVPSPTSEEELWLVKK